MVGMPARSTISYLERAYGQSKHDAMGSLFSFWPPQFSCEVASFANSTAGGTRGGSLVVPSRCVARRLRASHPLAAVLFPNSFRAATTHVLLKHGRSCRTFSILLLAKGDCRDTA
jgi:hypothetical protein